MKLTLTLALLPAALAVPHYSGHGHGPHKSGHHGTGGLFPTDGPLGPYGLGNATTGLGSTGLATAVSSASSILYSTVPVFKPYPSKNGAGAAASVLAPEKIGNLASVGDQGSCGPQSTTTVTYANTVTVTATPSQATAAVVSSAAAVSTPVQASEAPASAPAASNSIPVETYGPAPVQQSSVAPVISSSSSTPAPTVASVTPAASTSATSSAVAVPATSAAPSPSASTAPSSGPGVSSKRGVIIPAGGSDQAALVSAFSNSPKISWVGNWYSFPPPDLPSSIEFVPQNYGAASDEDGTWTKNAKTAVSAGDKYFLSFGEPETTNAVLYMDPQNATDLWMSKMQPYTSQGVTIGAPGVLQNTQDFTWLSQFLDLCDAAGCDIGFIAIHWFYVADPGNVQGFKDVINNATSVAKGKPVWLDNFQATGTMAAQQEFFSEVLPFLESNEGVARYAYVSCDQSTGTAFVNGDGSISTLGQYYANF
ncbi:hypothetical protein MMC28_004030 [Mycoblastus sanguinarius]|nr:hypothetical protein [Mycoblastus sanguinarius]